MKKIKLVIQYDGTGFHGFQKQLRGERTVQGEVDVALEQLFGTPVVSAGAARTDAGVHAFGQVMSFFADTTIPPDKIAAALRPFLPEDIQAVSSSEQDDYFSARFSATGKEYRYLFYKSPANIPFLRNRAYHVMKQLDVVAMKNALRHMEGEHDFSSFRNENNVESTPIRKIFFTDVEEQGIFTTVVIRGSGFLYRMVRNIAGTALSVGRGRTKPEDIPGIIESRDRTKAGQTLPPEGLYLVKVYYGNVEKDDINQDITGIVYPEI